MYVGSMSDYLFVYILSILFSHFVSMFYFYTLDSQGIVCVFDHFVGLTLKGLMLISRILFTRGTGI